MAQHIQKRKVNIKLEGVYKIYKQGPLEVVALKDISLEIYEGELIVIMGPSGSGKTTLLNVISGMDKPTAGKVKVSDIETTDLKDKAVQRILQTHIGIVFQFFNLVPSLTAYGNIELPMIIAEKPKNERRERVKKLLEDIEMVDRQNHRPFTLSGGEKQRVAVAMAFANDPTIVLADEPSGNIDSNSAEKVIDIFHTFIKNNPHKSIVIVTHDPIFRKIADRTFILKDGKIIRELGRKELEEEEQAHTENISELEKIYALKGGKDKVAQILNPTMRFPLIEDVKECPQCGKPDIIKKHDKADGQCKIRNNQVLSRVAIFCPDCYQMTYEWMALLDIKRDIG